MRRVHAGQLNRFITFEVRAPGTDAMGQANGAWQPVPSDATVWAAGAFVTGRDVAVAGQLQATLDAKFIVRYRTDIVANTWRIVDDTGQPFDIVGEPAPIDGGREFLEVRCTAGVRDGR